MFIEFSQQILEKKTQILIFMKIHQWGVELFHADRDGLTDGTTDERTDMLRFAILRTRLKTAEIYCPNHLADEARVIIVCLLASNNTCT
jgi:hypothetical protein